jgi:hypothetical protein|uniref:Uncharacterized protein n=1 Tax=viral metagenome TaxID=1070528 RepID=A0A6C0BIT1_9ZZZZ
MGINYSHVMCAASNKDKTCAQFPPIPYLVYQHNIKNKTPQQIQSYVCGTREGRPVQCCNPWDPAANDVVTEAPMLRSLKNQEGQYTEFQICDCQTPACENQYCPVNQGFARPTQYELCKARPVDPANRIRLSEHVYKVVAANTYTNCYQLC